ncbi:MAG: hypothetical protein KBG48_26820 [Kofleriaceae bacterium]|nr:hypothetical protein [Kofleriaceae bacterium]MBP9171040.1 hypothetical protein [Kofleriaceae bacterium]MBP9862367.1 hypothetical protein [Kofleriaceae bacterium]
MSRAAGSRVAGAALAVALASGCGGDDGEPPPADCEVAAGTGPVMPATGLCQELSSYRLFTDLPGQVAQPELVRFDLVEPLFSDYTDKARWLYLPPGQAAAWRDGDEPLALPVGAILVKSFAYPRDRRDPGAGRLLLETRLLLHQADGWRAASYVYRPDGSDADLSVAGEFLDTSWIHDDGATRTNRYVVPNINQCGNCHGEFDGVVAPLGPRARRLNRPAASGGGNQLEAMIAAGRLTGAPPAAAWPIDHALGDASASLDQRARTWLDVNCAHCHNPRGPARTSGLDLSIGQTEPERFGVCKTPVAAGPGSGGLRFDIVPGQPEQSILMFRLNSVEPAIRMPELGRNLVHAESVALLGEWITQLPGACPTP